MSNIVLTFKMRTNAQVFFVLKKNYRQITFLHVYHHAGMAGGVWVGARFLGGGNIIYLGYLNCIVHIAMYSYYLLSVFSKSYKNSVWWKRHITHLQLLQFGLLVIMFIILLVSDCAFPKFVSVFLIPQNFFMFYLFGDFYIKTYISPKRKSKISSADKE